MPGCRSRSRWSCGAPRRSKTCACVVSASGAATSSGDVAVAETRSAFYALEPGGWRDYVTLLHPPYTLWHLSYVAIGAALAPGMTAERLLVALAAFFLAVGIGAHALDELHGHPLQTRISDRTLIVLSIVSIGGAVALGVYGVARLHAVARAARRGRWIHRRRVQPRALRRRLPLRPVVRARLGGLPAARRLPRSGRANHAWRLARCRVRRLSEPRPAPSLDARADGAATRRDGLRDARAGRRRAARDQRGER